MLGRSGVFTCRACRRTKSGNYFISPTLCKKCAAKRRLKPDNPLIPSTEGILITEFALKRLQKKAGRETPKTLRSVSAAPLGMFFIFSGQYLSLAIFFKYTKGMGLWASLLAIVASFAAILVGMFVTEWLEAPRKKALNQNIEALVKERQQEIEEADRFYSSPEWWELRKRVIHEQGRTCAECQKSIRRQDDLTVDHIQPRSKFPALGLDFANLRVLCRSCNSRKGDRLL